MTLFPVGFIIGGFWFYTHPEVEDAMVGAVTFWAILPQRYQILDDRLKVILGGPLSLNIAFDSIKEEKKEWKR